MSAMSHPIRRLTQVFATTTLFLSTGVTAALAGPAPIEPEFPRDGRRTRSTGGTDSADGFPWLLTSIAVLLAVSALALIAVLWHRTRSGHHGLVTPVRSESR